MAQIGNQNAVKNRPITAAIMKALEKETERRGITTTKMHALAAELVDQAIGGNLSAINQVLDRIEGKPIQQAQITSNNNVLVSAVTGEELARLLALVPEDTIIDITPDTSTKTDT